MRAGRLRDIVGDEWYTKSPFPVEIRLLFLERISRSSEWMLSPERLVCLLTGVFGTGVVGWLMLMLSLFKRARIIGEDRP